jgi:hypothetical protein
MGSTIRAPGRAHVDALTLCALRRRSGFRYDSCLPVSADAGHGRQAGE